MSHEPPATDRPFAIAPPPGASAFRRAMCRLAERALDLDGLSDLAMRGEIDGGPAPYCQRVLDALGASIEVRGMPDADRLAGRPLVVVANHPFGGLEGLALDAALRRVRPDVKIMATTMLAGVRGMHEGTIFVDNLGGLEATAANQAPIRETMRWLRGGHALGVFPAGAVAALRLREMAVVEQPWAPMIGRIVKRCDAWVLPVFFEGRNRWPFHAIGVIHPSLRRLLLARELTSARGKRVVMHVGRLMPPELWSRFEDGGVLTEHLRLRTELLRPQRQRRRAKLISLARQHRQRRAAAQARRPEPVIEAMDPARVAEDVAQLGETATLARSGGLEVLAFDAAHAPALMHEIGRLREITFRAVGEGTGRRTDIDRFDQHYLQLALWDRERRRVAGGYRLGQTDVIGARHGLDGLYVHSLFELSQKLMEQIGPALELGRSFVASEYQRGYAPLMLLWRGIGAYCAKHPRYRRLFGPVSISADYSDLSRELLVRFLTLSVPMPGLAQLIRPRNPLREQPPRALQHESFSRVARNLDEVNQLVREIEQDGKAIPVLLRQYLKLNAKLLGFNVDADFGDVVDGLMYVDLVNVDQRILGKYMGSAAAAAFVAHHSGGQPDAGTEVSGPDRASR